MEWAWLHASEETNTQKVFRDPEKGPRQGSQAGWAQPQADCGRVWVSLGGCWEEARRLLRHALSGRGSPGELPPLHQA